MLQSRFHCLLAKARTHQSAQACDVHYRHIIRPPRPQATCPHRRSCCAIKTRHQTCCPQLPAHGERRCTMETLLVNIPGQCTHDRASRRPASGVGARRRPRARRCSRARRCLCQKLRATRMRRVPRSQNGGKAQTRGKPQSGSCLIQPASATDTARPRSTERRLHPYRPASRPRRLSATRVSYYRAGGVQPRTRARCLPISTACQTCDHPGNQLGRRSCGSQILGIRVPPLPRHLRLRPQHHQTVITYTWQGTIALWAQPPSQQPPAHRYATGQ
mmetsp:Transcript_43587/g.90957  ORF Transcript_43587/g.90957 Transcript_43587/m.90957 type:complete len:274 (-) Transcript_43587:528-1349(-)